MKSRNLLLIHVITGLCAICLVSGGCQRGRTRERSATALIPKSDLGPTIGSVAQVYAADTIAVEGYGVVGGLKGTGSAEYPSALRPYLVRHISGQVSGTTVNVDRILSSLNTSVVRLDGRMPAGAARGEAFDVRVSTLPGSQTLSLESGWLLPSELVMEGGFGVTTDVVAKVQGPVYIDQIGSGKKQVLTGYVLGAGRTLNDYKLAIALAKQDYRLANAIVNRLNERYGFNTARAISPAMIQVSVPARYSRRRPRFVALVAATYLSENPAITVERVRTYVRELATAEDKFASEIALEAIGVRSLDKLGTLLNSSNEKVRLGAARCMLSLGDDRGLATLREIALNPKSPNRIEALEAVGRTALRSEAAALAVRLLQDKDFSIILAAYEQLRRLEDVSIAKTAVAKSFLIEQVAQAGDRVVYAARSGEPRVVLFGGPMRCRGNVFVQSEDGRIIINAPTGQPYVSVIRKNPKRAGDIARLASSYELSDIIRVMCEEPGGPNEEGPGGLGIPYAEMIAMVKQMCDKGAIAATFAAGPMPKIGE